MFAWILPVAIIPLVGFGIFLIAAAWEGSSFSFTAAFSKNKPMIFLEKVGGDVWKKVIWE